MDHLQPSCMAQVPSTRLLSPPTADSGRFKFIMEFRVDVIAFSPKKNYIKLNKKISEFFFACIMEKNSKIFSLIPLDITN